MKKNLTKYFSDYIFNDNNRVSVNAKTPEKAAKKLYKMSKNRFYEIGYVKVFSLNNEEWCFNCKNWLGTNGKKFNSKPK